MTVPSEARVTQRAEEVAEDVTSAANIVTNGGYYEIDTNAVTAVITRFEAEVTQSTTAPLLDAIEAAREALESVSMCFEAARAEGLTEQLGAFEAEPGNLVDIVQRRLLWADHYALQGLVTLSRLTAELKKHGRD
jgi:hypothetical protein